MIGKQSPLKLKSAYSTAKTELATVWPSVKFNARDQGHAIEHPLHAWLLLRKQTLASVACVAPVACIAKLSSWFSFKVRSTCLFKSA